MTDNYLYLLNDGLLQCNILCFLGITDLTKLYNTQTRYFKIMNTKDELEEIIFNKQYLENETNIYSITTILFNNFYKSFHHMLHILQETGYDTEHRRRHEMFFLLKNMIAEYYIYYRSNKNICNRNKILRQFTKYSYSSEGILILIKRIISNMDILKSSKGVLLMDYEQFVVDCLKLEINK
jgi:hypothetical protein